MPNYRYLQHAKVHKQNALADLKVIVQLFDLTTFDVQSEREELKLQQQQQQNSEHTNLSYIVQHTCHEVLTLHAAI